MRINSLFFLREKKYLWQSRFLGHEQFDQISHQRDRFNCDKMLGRLIPSSGAKSGGACWRRRGTPLQKRRRARDGLTRTVQLSPLAGIAVNQTSADGIARSSASQWLDGTATSLPPVRIWMAFDPNKNNIVYLSARLTSGAVKGKIYPMNISHV